MILYPTKEFFKSEGENKTFPGKQNGGSLLPQDLPCKKS